MFVRFAIRERFARVATPICSIIALERTLADSLAADASPVLFHVSRHVIDDSCPRPVALWFTASPRLSLFRVVIGLFSRCSSEAQTSFRKNGTTEPPSFLPVASLFRNPRALFRQRSAADRQRVSVIAFVRDSKPRSPGTRPHGCGCS